MILRPQRTPAPCRGSERSSGEKRAQADTRSRCGMRRRQGTAGSFRTGFPAVSRGLRGAVLALPVLFLLAGCAGMLQPQAAREAAVRELQVRQLISDGRFGEARELWKGIAQSRHGSPAGEEALYRAALMLVHPENPSPDYRQAAAEFSALIAEYPQGAHAVDAGAWRAALNRQEASQMTELLERSASLARKLEQTASALASTEAERSALVREGEGLRSQIDALIRERDGVRVERAALARERDGLARDKSALEKDLVTMMKERDRLRTAKAKLEQRLRDVTEVDIRMEKKRRNIAK